MGVNKPTPNPTVGAIVTSLQRKLRIYRMVTEPRSKREAIKYKNQLERMLGITLISDDEMHEKYPELVEHTRSHGVAAYLPNGEVALFAAPAAKGLAGKRRKQGKAFIEDMLLGGNKKNVSKHANASKLPDHIRLYMKDQGLDPDTIEALNHMLDKVEFRYKNVRYVITSRWKQKVKRQIDGKNTKKMPHLNYSPDPDLQEIDLVQISMPTKPLVRLTKLGVSIKSLYPQATMIALTGRTLDKVIDFPGFDKMTIGKVSVFGSTVTQIRLK